MYLDTRDGYVAGKPYTLTGSMECVCEDDE